MTIDFYKHTSDSIELVLSAQKFAIVEIITSTSNEANVSPKI